MSGHRVELLAHFTVDDDDDGGREAAESVVRQLEYLAEHGQLDDCTLNLTFVPLTVDGVDWDQKWPPKPKSVTRCGYLVEYSTNAIKGRPGAYRVSKDGRSNIIGESFYRELSSDGDAAFEEFMTAALRPDFPHPFMVEAKWGTS